jgi:hypothetical protein
VIGQVTSYGPNGSFPLNCSHVKTCPNLGFIPSATPAISAPLISRTAHSARNHIFEMPLNLFAAPEVYPQKSLSGEDPHARWIDRGNAMHRAMLSEAVLECANRPPRG